MEQEVKGLGKYVRDTEVPKAQPQSCPTGKVLARKGSLFPRTVKGQEHLRQVCPCSQWCSLQLRTAASEQLSYGEKERMLLPEKDFCFHDTASAIIVLCDQGKS